MHACLQYCTYTCTMHMRYAHPRCTCTTYMDNMHALYTYDAFTPAAGDILLMHPLLIHSASDAHRSTCTPDGKWVRHGLRITFNLATKWRRPPLRGRAHSARSPLGEGTGRRNASPRPHWPHQDGPLTPLFNLTPPLSDPTSSADLAPLCSRTPLSNLAP